MLHQMVELAVRGYASSVNLRFLKNIQLFFFLCPELNFMLTSYLHVTIFFIFLLCYACEPNIALITSLKVLVTSQMRTGWAECSAVSCVEFWPTLLCRTVLIQPHFFFFTERQAGQINEPVIIKNCIFVCTRISWMI